MFICSPRVIEVIPEEYRAVSEALFPIKDFSEGDGPTVEAAADFAEVLGIGAEYKKLLSCDMCERDIRHFLGHFRNNLDLLIQKTWVERDDEIRKERLQDRVPAFISEIEKGDYKKALADFGTVLDELAYLLFGAQSKKDDFTEYALRIDTQMGLFWWYGAQIGRLEKINDNEILRALLLIGICYLTNF